ncbi:MAG TPA: Hpt domain-containing protein [Candidatus Melainabacteria bacterium]|jgi:HPt (histidine-containing phosphotransfer) domain-containing protein|nr:Hpt domain-containing protein [Candidatus Melainabacteria bacterium]HIN65522.1 Hpt domain-containing protein [Candidatus Obscuribacterales bacterium]
MSNNDDTEKDADYDAALEDVLKSLRGDYLIELPDRVAEMNEFFDKARSDVEKQVEWLTEAHTIAHRLAGTAGSYGFAELGRAAAELDQYLKKLLKKDAETGSVANRLNWQMLNGLVEEVGKAVPPNPSN